MKFRRARSDMQLPAAKANIDLKPFAGALPQ
jgi:hypothetical protein